jgi:hypothetical protein
MGSLNGVQAGLRNLRRTRPLETMRIETAPGAVVTAPTPEEMLRVNAYLIVQRNAVRDSLDVVALADHVGVDQAGLILREIDDYYDRSQQHGSVRTSLALALVDPSPHDVDVIADLPGYRGLDPRWHDWGAVTSACTSLALEVAQG